MIAVAARLQIASESLTREPPTGDWLLALRPGLVARRLGIRFWGEVGGQIIDDGVELLVGTIRSFVDHIADDLLPSLLRIATPENNFRSVTAAADFLYRFLARAVGQL